MLNNFVNLLDAFEPQTLMKCIGTRIPERPWLQRCSPIVLVRARWFISDPHCQPFARGLLEGGHGMRRAHAARAACASCTRTLRTRIRRLSFMHCSCGGEAGCARTARRRNNEKHGASSRRGTWGSQPLKQAGALASHAQPADGCPHTTRCPCLYSTPVMHPNLQADTGEAATQARQQQARQQQP